MCLRPVISDFGWFSPDTASARLAMFLARSPVRSRSPAILSTVMMWRKSFAIGWRRAIIRMVCSCSSRSSWSMARSLKTTFSPSLRIALFERIKRLRQQPLGQPAHLGDFLVEQEQLLVE